MGRKWLGSKLLDRGEGGVWVGVKGGRNKGKGGGSGGPGGGAGGGGRGAGPGGGAWTERSHQSRKDMTKTTTQPHTRTSLPHTHLLIHIYTCVYTHTLTIHMLLWT